MNNPGRELIDVRADYVSHADYAALLANFVFSVEAHDEATQEVIALRAQVESLQDKWASRPLSSEDQARLIKDLESAIIGSRMINGLQADALADERHINRQLTEALRKLKEGDK